MTISRRYRYGKRVARTVEKGVEVRMADGEWATITRVEPQKHTIRWRMERGGRFLSYIDVWTGSRYNTRRRLP